MKASARGICLDYEGGMAVDVLLLMTLVHVHLCMQLLMPVLPCMFAWSAETQRIASGEPKQACEVTSGGRGRGLFRLSVQVQA